MRYDHIFSAVALGVLIASSPAHADDQFHCPQPGTVMTYDDGTSLTFMSQTGMVCLVRGLNGSARRLLGIANAGSDFDKNNGERLFPWRIGNEIDFDSTGDSSHMTGSVPTGNTTVFYHDSVKVTRQEKLVTAAGTFDTFVIEWHEQIRNRDIQGAWLYTIWFAPDVGYVVKRKDETRLGFGKNTAWEITSLKLSQATSPPTASTQEQWGPPGSGVGPVGTGKTISCKSGVCEDASPAPSLPAPASSLPKTSVIVPPNGSSPAGTNSNPPQPLGTSAQRLQELKDLLDRKLITPAEYEAKRNAILDPQVATAQSQHPAAITSSARVPTSTVITSAPNPPAPSGSTPYRLQALKDLLDRKLITQQDYAVKRKAILDGPAVETIRLEQQGGTFLVPVQLNGRITLNFILDSGAADVSVPADVVLTLIRTGTVADRDFIGTKTYVLADGSKLPSPSFIIHELKVGEHVVKNVAASVTPVQGALLLGQSFLSKLPSWTIDNKQHNLIISQ